MGVQSANPKAEDSVIVRARAFHERPINLHVSYVMRSFQGQKAERSREAMSSGDVQGVLEAVRNQRDREREKERDKEIVDLAAQVRSSLVSISAYLSNLSRTKGMKTKFRRLLMAASFDLNDIIDLRLPLIKSSKGANLLLFAAGLLDTIEKDMGSVDLVEGRKEFFDMLKSIKSCSDLIRKKVGEQS